MEKWIALKHLRFTAFEHTLDIEATSHWPLHAEDCLWQFYNCFVLLSNSQSSTSHELKISYLEIFSVNYYYHEFTARQFNYFGFMCKLKVFK